MNRAPPGFTLLEVLVAFVIAALALGVLFEGAAGSLRAVHDAQRYEQAVARAKSHLAVVGHGQALAPGAQQGDDGSGFHWATRIAVADTAQKPASREVVRAPPVSLTLYNVTVTEAWTDGGKTRQVTLRTQQVAASAEPHS